MRGKARWAQEASRARDTDVAKEGRRAGRHGDPSLPAKSPTPPSSRPSCICAEGSEPSPGEEANGGWSVAPGVAEGSLRLEVHGQVSGGDTTTRAHLGGAWSGGTPRAGRRAGVGVVGVCLWCKVCRWSQDCKTQDARRWACGRGSQPAGIALWVTTPTADTFTTTNNPTTSTTTTRLDRPAPWR